MMFGDSSPTTMCAFCKKSLMQKARIEASQQDVPLNSERRRNWGFVRHQEYFVNRHFSFDKLPRKSMNISNRTSLQNILQFDAQLRSQYIYEIQKQFIFQLSLQLKWYLEFLQQKTIDFESVTSFCENMFFVRSGKIEDCI